MCVKSIRVVVQKTFVSLFLNFKVNQGRKHSFLLRGVKWGYAVHRGRAENTLQWYKSLHDNHSDQVQNGSNWSIVVHLDLWGVEDIIYSIF